MLILIPNLTLSLAGLELATDLEMCGPVDYIARVYLAH